MSSFITNLKNAASQWVEDTAPRMSAALAYYAIFSVAPLLVITVALIGLVFGQEAASGQLSDQLASLVGRDSAETIQEAVEAAGRSTSGGIWATVVGSVILIFGATTAFAELKNSLNLIWGVTSKPGSAIKTLIRDRFLSFSLILCIGFLLLVSLALSAVISGVNTYIGDLFSIPPMVWKAMDFAISLAIISTLFGLIFKILPDVILTTKDVLGGAILTGLLFTVGKILLAWYLGTSAVASSFGAAGSLVVLLLWFYYATCILFFGAEYVKVSLQGRHIGLRNYAVKIDPVRRNADDPGPVLG